MIYSQFPIAATDSAYINPPTSGDGTGNMFVGVTRVFSNDINFHALLKFDLDQGITRTEFARAVLSLYIKSKTGYLLNTTFTAHVITQTAWTSSATWLTYDGSTLWTQAGGDIGPAIATAGIPALGGRPNHVKFDITPTVKAGLGDDLSIMILTSEVGENRFVTVGGSDDANPLYRPYLTLTPVVRPGLDIDENYFA